ncbi:MAG: TetR/AcrR family transcriptional regulator [Oscillospiraceae bacterium]|nr:TetR/AcrR family transcriptional regulator [Oscillospiraceae bacterium]
MGKVEENKLQKEQNLMDTAFSLFSSKGIARTSISDIVQQAGIAKGTFYLYFRDKYDLQEKLIIHKSEQLIRHALTCSGFEEQDTPSDKIITIVDDVLDQLRRNPHLLRFIDKNLSWGIFHRAITRSETDYLALFEKLLSWPGGRSQLEMTVYMVLEFVGSTCYSVILDADPVDLDHFKPYLHRAVRSIMESCLSAS